MENHKIIRNSFTVQAHWCAKLGSPFTSKLLTGLSKSLDCSTATEKKILNWPGQADAMADALALRLAGALHGLVRVGRLPQLAQYYPPNPEPEADVLTLAAMEAIAEADVEICQWLTHAPQTNEVARSAILYPGMMVIAKETGLPLSIFELGSSAGLNLNLEKFSYRFANDEFGTPGSPLVLSPIWHGTKPNAKEPVIDARCGCDLNPHHVPNPDHRMRLLGYIWPDQTERLARVEAAVEIALDAPAHLDKADAADWVEKLITPSPENGTCRVLFHSIAYQYFPRDAKQRITAHMEAIGAAASPDTPLAWLAFEQLEDHGACLTLRLWRGAEGDGELRVLAKANNAHVQEVEWLG
jgi:hypothetical protein